MSSVQVLQINLHNTAIGTLTLLDGDRSIFAFNDDYLNNPDRATLSLSFLDPFGDLITQTNPTQTALSPFFSNLLPEGRMRDYLANRAGVKKMREFHLLMALGKDLPGAITVGALHDANWDVDDIGQPAAVAEENTSDGALRFSLAGVQIKFSAIQDAAGGLTVPVSGQGGSYIIKLPSTRFKGVPVNEHAMMKLAGLLGMDVPPHRLVDPEQIIGIPPEVASLNEPVFAIERFDRTLDGGRVHIEDFAQVFGVYPDKKYTKATYRSILHVLAIETGARGIQDFIRRLVFNTLIGNADMHLKNWSLIYHDQKTPSLAPAYDFVSTIAFLDDEKAALKYAKQKVMTAVTYDELAQLAAKANAPEALVVDTAKETAQQFHETWQREKGNLGLTPHMINVIDDHYQRAKLLTDL